MHHNLVCILLLIQGMLCTNCLYSYDRFNNKQLTLDTSFNNVYYTSNKFHSIEYTNPSDKSSNNVIKNNRTNTTQIIIHLRKPNSTQSLPNLYNI